MKKTIITTTIILLSLTGSLHAQNIESQREKAMELLRLTNALEMSTQVFDQIMVSLNSMFKKVPENVWKEVSSSLNTKKYESLMVDFYIDSYTESEIDAMIAFYSSPEGKSILLKTPEITQKSMQIGLLWGRQEAAKVIKKLNEKGYKQTML